MYILFKRQPQCYILNFLGRKSKSQENILAAAANNNWGYKIHHVLWFVIQIPLPGLFRKKVGTILNLIHSINLVLFSTTKHYSFSEPKREWTFFNLCVYVILGVYKVHCYPQLLCEALASLGLRAFPLLWGIHISKGKLKFYNKIFKNHMISACRHVC